MHKLLLLFIRTILVLVTNYWTNAHSQYAEGICFQYANYDTTFTLPYCSRNDTVSLCRLFCTHTLKQVFISYSTVKHQC